MLLLREIFENTSRARDAQDRDSWRAIVAEGMRLSDFVKCGEFLD